MVLFVSQGPMPLDAAPQMTRDQISEYVEGLVALLMEVACSEDVEVADTASNVLRDPPPHPPITPSPKSPLSAWRQ
jgi:hypothetical protein